MIYRRQGFTLIELLVVVLIIGILAAIALPQYQAARDKAKYSNFTAFTASVSSSAERYRLTNGTYPSAFQDLDLDLPSGGVFSVATAITQDVTYPWGTCTITKDIGVYCKNYNDIKAGYTVYFDKASYKPGVRLCFAFTREPNDRPNKLCKAITGRSTFSSAEICDIPGGGSTPCYTYYF